MVSYEGIKSIFHFMIITLPTMAIEFLNMCFTPLNQLFPKVQRIFYFALSTNPFGNFIYDNFIVNLFEIGVVGLFTGTTLMVIVIIKLIDLVIPL